MQKQMIKHIAYLSDARPLLPAQAHDAIHLRIPELQELWQRRGGDPGWFNQLPHVMSPIHWVFLLG